MADNAGKPTLDLRMRKLHVTAPPSLALQFVQAGVFDQGMNLKNACGEGGDGSFSWLLRIDTAGGRLTTGGAPPTSDPFSSGYCFTRGTLDGFAVAPASVGLTRAADGSYASDVIPVLDVALYVHGQPNDTFILPLTQARFEGVTVSAGGNCVGAYNPAGVSPPSALGTCQDQDPSSCERWQTAGSVGGIIKLKDAEAVIVQDLGKTLCVLLTSGSATTNGGKNCATDANGNVVAKGDFCSQTGVAGGCADSMWMAATFAASAATIDDVSPVPACNGG
jgi:hypothetical protein